MDDESEPWTCRTCTFINQPTFLSCGACGTLKPHQIKLPSLSSASSSTRALLEEKLRKKAEKKLTLLQPATIASSSASSTGTDVPTPPPLTPPPPPDEDLTLSPTRVGLGARTSPVDPSRYRLIEDKWREGGWRDSEWSSGTAPTEKLPEDIEQLKKELEAKEVEIRGLKEELRGLTMEKKTKDQQLTKKVAEFQNALDKSENTTARIINLVLDLLTESTSATSLKEKLTPDGTSPPTEGTTSPTSAVDFEFVKQKLIADVRKVKTEWNLKLEDDLSKARSIEERDRERFQELRECVVCMESLRTCVFQPCSHVAACVTCASTLTECPVCRKQVTSFLRAFIW